MRSRLTAAFILVVLTPLAIGLVLASRVLPRVAETQQALTMVSRAALAGQILRGDCDRAEATAEAVGRAAGTSSPASATSLARTLVSRGLADGVRVVGPNGRVVVAVGRVPAAPPDCGGSVPARAGDALTAVLPLSTSNGRPAGTALASFSLSGQVLLRLQAALAGSAVAVVDAGGAVVAASGTVRPDDVRRAQHVDGRAHDGRIVGWSAAGSGQPYGVVVVEAAAAGPGMLGLALGLALVGVLLAAAIAMVSARAVTGPFDELGAAAARVAKGDFSTVIPVRRRDEAGRLAESFNAMTAELRDQVGQLEASRSELQAGLARLGDTLSSTHDLDRILSVVLTSAMASTRATSGMILLVAPGRQELSLAASRGLNLPLDLTLAMGEGVSGSVADSGIAVRGRLGGGPDDLAPARVEPQETSVIAVPMLSGQTVLGVLDLFGSAAPGGFGEEDLGIIRTFASQATVALENVLLHEEAQRLSVTDALTGLWNYRYFTLSVNREIERAARFERPLSVLMIDLDHFKLVNDSYGHPRGDAVLRELADRLRSCVRDVDIVARYGGEELVVVLPETDEGGAGRLAERICSVVRDRPFGPVDEPPIWITVSAGAAVFPQHGPTAGVLVAHADEALYAAKHGGRDGWRLFATGADGNSTPH